MTVVVTLNVAYRFRGFLASCMLELAAGVYSAPRMTPAVRERIWNVLSEWHAERSEGSIVMTWRDKTMPGGQSVRILGSPPIELVDYDGIVLAAKLDSRPNA